MHHVCPLEKRIVSVYSAVLYGIVLITAPHEVRFVAPMWCTSLEVVTTPPRVAGDDGLAPCHAS